MKDQLELETAIAIFSAKIKMLEKYEYEDQQCVSGHPDAVSVDNQQHRRQEPVIRYERTEQSQVNYDKVRQEKDTQQINANDASVNLC